MSEIPSNLRHPANQPAECPLCADVGMLLDRILDALDCKQATTLEDLARMGHVLEAIAGWWARRGMQMTGGDPAPVLETIRAALKQNGIDVDLLGFDGLKKETRH